MTSCPGALKFTGSTHSPSAALRHAAATVSSSAPRMAAMAPSPGGTASCMACARKRTSGTASRNASAPEATSAEYSPRLCPASSAGTLPPAACHARHTATAAVSITGCVLTVRSRASSGPCETSAHRSSPSTSRGLVECSPHDRMAVEALHHAHGLRALAGENECDLHRWDLSSRGRGERCAGISPSGRARAPGEAAAHAAIITCWPARMRPSRTAQSSASGIEAAEVFA